MSLLKKLQSEARLQYDQVVPAFAYVFKHNNENGLRLEAPDIVLEYSNGVPFGRDPRGLLYYYGLADFKLSKDMKYKVTIERRTEGGATKEEVLVIGIWNTTDSFTTDKPYAKFIAGVPVRAWGQTQPAEVNGGKWQPLNVLQATSLAESAGNKALVTLTMDSLKKQFSFDIPPDGVDGSVIECHGSLIAKDFSQLTGTGVFVDYTNTRILIFRKQYDPTPIAVFSPLELPKDTPLVDRSFQVQNGRFTNL